MTELGTSSSAISIDVGAVGKPTRGRGVCCVSVVTARCAAGTVVAEADGPRLCIMILFYQTAQTQRSITNFPFLLIHGADEACNADCTCCTEKSLRNAGTACFADTHHAQLRASALELAAIPASVVASAAWMSFWDKTSAEVIERVIRRCLSIRGSR